MVTWKCDARAIVIKVEAVLELRHERVLKRVTVDIMGKEMP
jgi:hypothetical protein